MPLSDYLMEEAINLDFRAINKSVALSELCSLAASLYRLSGDEVLQAVLAREATGSTGVGGGVALPHGQYHNLEKPVMVLARTSRGIEYDSLDGLPVHILVLFLTVKDGDAREHLQLLARLGRFFSSPDNVALVAAAPDSKTIQALLKERD